MLSGRNYQLRNYYKSDEFGNGDPAHILEHKSPYKATLARNLANWSHAQSWQMYWPYGNR